MNPVLSVISFLVGLFGASTTFLLAKDVGGFFVQTPIAAFGLCAICFSAGYWAHALVERFITKSHEDDNRRRKVRWRDMDPFMLEFLMGFTEKHGPLPYAAQGGGWQVLRDAGAIFECKDTGYDPNRGTWWFINEGFRKKVIRRKRWIKRRISKIRGDDRYAVGTPIPAGNPFENK